MTPPPKALLEELVRAGRSVPAIAGELGISEAMVLHWLGKHGLRTEHQGTRAPTEIRECARHGPTDFVREGSGYFRCVRCRSEAVGRRRRRVKEILVAEAGGRCTICGYDRSIAALQFHHRDPATKAFTIGNLGITRSLDRMRNEARKCVLLCANCHAEVEAGRTILSAPDPG